MAQQDVAIIERRLRPIYDALDNKNFKKALHETEKVLKKTSNLLCALALKGYALIRLGRMDEGESIIKQVVDERSSDDLKLQVLTYVFKDLDDYASICEMYERAVEEDKNNEELLTQLFVSQTRLNRFSDQQKVAMQLYKMKQKNPYYCWAVMSLLLKATQGVDKSDPIKRKISLELAQRMMEKFINDHKLEAEQEAQLYLIICQKQNKYAEQLAFLDSEIGEQVYPGAPIELRMELMKHMKHWTKLNVMLKVLLRDNIDRWDYYKDYIQTVAELVTGKEEEKPNEDQRVDNTFELCHKFLSELVELGNKKYRGPYLARLELYRVMDQHGHDAKALFGEFIEMLIDYFRIFGEKPCCAKDIILFLGDLKAEQRPELASKLIRLCDISATTLPQSKEQMQRHICSLQISRICGAHKLSADHLTALYTAFTLHYEHGLNAFNVDMLPTDIGIPDAFALLAVHVMYDVAIKLNSSNHMVEALCLSHYLLANSTSNFHAKLLCIQLYHRIGCAYAAHKMYKLLNLKFIQLHSMGYLHCARLATSGIYTIAVDAYKSTETFFENYLHEGHEFIAMCYKFGSFSKLEEFMEFRDKLMNSFHCMLTSWDNAILGIVCFQSMSGHSFHEHALNVLKGWRITEFSDDWATNHTDFGRLSDDRDLSVIARWNPIDKQTESQQNDEIHCQDMYMARIRFDMLGMIMFCVETVTKEKFDRRQFKGFNGGTLERDYVTKCPKRWPNLFAKVRSANYTVASDEYLVNQLPSRLHGLLELPYEGIFQNIVELALSLEHRLTEPIDNVRQRLEQHFKNLDDIVRTRIDENNASEDRLWNRRVVQDTIGMGAELSSIATFLLAVIHEKYISSATNKVAKRNRKKAAKDANLNDASICIPNERERITAITSIVNQLKTTVNSFDAAVGSWKVPVLSKTLTENLASLSLNPNIEIMAGVYDNIKESHELIVGEVRANLAHKISVLNNMTKNNA